jgi:hypothetical protein
MPLWKDPRFRLQFPEHVVQCMRTEETIDTEDDSDAATRMKIRDANY